MPETHPTAVAETPRRPRARLFVALELPPEIRAAVARWRDASLSELPGPERAGLRGVVEDHLHVTLCFLGGVDPEGVPDILTACETVSGRAAAVLKLGGALWLPPRRPGVLAIGLEDVGGRLAAVQATLSAALAVGGSYRPEIRAFLPHVTVARVRRAARMRRRGLAGPHQLEFVGRAVTLFRSHTDPRGARYEPLGTVELS